MTRSAPATGRKALVEAFPDLDSLSDDDLKQLIDELTKEELEVSSRRRILHGKIDLLRAVCILLDVPLPYLPVEFRIEKDSE